MCYLPPIVWWHKKGKDLYLAKYLVITGSMIKSRITSFSMCYINVWFSTPPSSSKSNINWLLFTWLSSDFNCHCIDNSSAISAGHISIVLPVLYLATALATFTVWLCFFRRISAGKSHWAENLNWSFLKFLRNSWKSDLRWLSYKLSASIFLSWKIG